jgi:hypothetical protein
LAYRPNALFLAALVNRSSLNGRLRHSKSSRRPYGSMT